VVLIEINKKKEIKMTYSETLFTMTIMVATIEAACFILYFLFSKIFRLKKQYILLALATELIVILLFSYLTYILQ